jgi:peptide/nickel transport system substrate-binding protein
MMTQGRNSKIACAFVTIILGSLLSEARGDGPVLAEASNALGMVRSHAVSLVGRPSLPADFDNFPYADPHAPKGGAVRLAMLGTFENLNRFNIKALRAPLFLVGAVYESLMVRSQDEPKTLYPLIAQSIELDDKREHIVFHLDPRAHFSDKTPITSEDVLFTFDVLKSNGPPSFRQASGLVKSIEAPDIHTVRFDLTGANDRELPLTFASMPVLPKHATDAEHFSEVSLRPPVASGPYLVTEVKAGERLTLKRDPEYWGRDLPTRRGLFNIDEITIDYYRDAEALFEAFKAGLIDLREEQSAMKWARGYDFPAIANGEIVRQALSPTRPIGMEGFVFNLRKEMFKDVRLREAMSMMYDFEWINANYFAGQYRRTKSYFDESVYSSSGSPASEAERHMLAPFPDVVRKDILEGKWSPPRHDGSGRDREAAKKAMQLLIDSGYKRTASGLKKDGQLISFEIMVRNRDEEKLALHFAQALSGLGIDAQVRLVEEAQYNRRRQQLDYDMLIGQWLTVASPGGEQRSRWGAGSSNPPASINLAGVELPAIDALIDALVSSRTEDDLIGAARALDRVLLSGFYIVPLQHASETWVAYSSKLHHPEAQPKFPMLPYGMILDSWWVGQTRPRQ